MAALTIHGLCFAISSRSISSNIERGQGDPTQDAGAVSLMASAVDANLFQTAEPTESKSAETNEELAEIQSETSPEAPETLVEPSPENPTVVATLNDPLRPEIDPVSEFSMRSTRAAASSMVT